MRKDQFSVVAFNTKGFLIKGIKDELKIQDIMNRNFENPGDATLAYFYLKTELCEGNLDNYKFDT